MRRSFVPLVLVVAVFLGMLSSQVASTSAQDPGGLTPVVRFAEQNDISPPMRDIPPIKPPKESDIRVIPMFLMQKAGSPIASGGDPVLQASAGPGAMPGPLRSFEGIDGVTGCGGCLPPDTNGVPGKRFEVEIDDLGEPGHHDTFSLRLLEPGGYSASGTLVNGNVQVNP